MKKRLGTMCLGTLLVAAGLTLGRPPAKSGPTFAGLEGVAIVVDSLAENIETMGITHGVLSAYVEQRLRDAGVEVVPLEGPRAQPGDPALHVTVMTLWDQYVGQVTYSIHLSLTETVRLERDPELTVRAPTWSTGGIGICAKGWRKALVDDVLAFTDEFIGAYAAANADARR